MIAHDAAAVAVFATAGLVLGMAYFATLRRGVQIAVARRAWLPCMLLALARIGTAALFFTFAVRWGAAALLGAFAGFLLARQLVVHAARRLA